MVKCSCQGYVNRLTESATFSLDGLCAIVLPNKPINNTIAGKKKSADGFGFISKCDQCHEKCEGDKRRTYEKGHDKGEQCDGGKTADDVIESEKIKMDKVVVEPPKVENAKCLDRGNLTRLCVERCPADGKTCITEVTVDACTCAGKKVHLKESTKYDMKTKEVVFGSTPYKNLGYSRVCGDCFEYCESWPGEEKDYYVNDYITTCFNARKNN